MSEIIDNCYQSEKIELPTRPATMRAVFDEPVTLPGTPRMYAVGVHIWQGPVRVCGGYFPASTVAEAKAAADEYCRAHGVEPIKQENPVKAALLDGAGLLAFLVVLGLWFI